MIGCLPTQAIAFEWKPGFTSISVCSLAVQHASDNVAHWRQSTQGKWKDVIAGNRDY